MAWNKEARVWEGYRDAASLAVEALAAKGIRVNGTVEAISSQAPTRFQPSYEDMRDHQCTAISFVVTHADEGVLLADDMGLGKTAVALRAARAFKQPALVVCPAFVTGIWGDDDFSEVKKWWRDAWPPQVLEGVKAGPWVVSREDNKGRSWYWRGQAPIGWTTSFYDADTFPTLDDAEDFADKRFPPEERKRLGVSFAPAALPEAPLTVCNYSILHAWTPHLVGAVKTLVCDEAHYISNAKSGRSQALASIAAGCTQRIALTGTPLTNRPRDLWNLVDTISPGRFGKFVAHGIRYCCPPDAPVWMGDLTFKPIGDIRPGDSVVGWKRSNDRPDRPRKGFGGQNRLCTAKVLAVGRRVAPLVKVTMASGRTLVCTSDHMWASMHKSNGKYIWCRTRKGNHLAHVIDTPRPLAPEYVGIARWLGGIYDGEGNCTYTAINISQSRKHNPDVCAAIESALATLGVPYTIDGMGPHRKYECDRFRIAGGRQRNLEFLTWCAPVRRKRIEELILNGRFRTQDTIVSVEPHGEGEVVSLTTDTGNYVVYGYASKNCDGHQEEVPQRGSKLPKAVWRFEGASNLEELNKRLRFFMLRRTKKDVALQLPPRTMQTFLVDVKRANIAPPKSIIGDKRVSEKALRRALDLAADGKLPHVVELVKSHVASGNRVVVFCWRRTVCEALAAAFGEGAAFIHGGVLQRERQRRINSDWRILCANIDVTAGGISLTQASVGVYAELTWEPHEILQTMARLHRPGQEMPTLFQFPLARSSVDELVAKAILTKLDTFERAIGPLDERLGESLSSIRAKTSQEQLRLLYERLKKQAADADS
jgi:superfamily II DNA or RNA helicase